MKKKKNAFTLIELLAIIVILAIIAVITVPIILNIIENSRKGASIDSAYGYKDSVQQYYLSKSVGDTTSDVLAKEVTKTVSELEEDGLTVNGQKPSDGWVKINKGQVVDYSLKFGDYVVDYDFNTKESLATKGGILRKQLAFNSCDNPEYIKASQKFVDMITVDDSGIITAYNETEIQEDVLIPCKKGSVNITGIGNGAFGNKSFTTITIPDCITSIGMGAISGNSNLVSIKLGKNVNNIQMNAFFKNNVSNQNLKEIIVPESNPTEFEWTTITGGTYNDDTKQIEWPSDNSPIKITYVKE